MKSAPGPSSSSSGSGSPKSATVGVLKERVGKYDLSSLSKTWDNDEKVRSRVRDNNFLLQTWNEMEKIATNTEVEKTVENCKHNSFVLAPVLKLIKENQGMLPALDRLIQTIDWFYQTCKSPKSLEHCYKQAWAVRDLVATLKSLTYRNAPPTETFLHIYIYIYIYIYNH